MFKNLTRNGKTLFIYALYTVFLCCYLKLLSCASFIKAWNVLPTPYLQGNKIISLSFYTDFPWQQQFAIFNHSFKAFHFTKLIKSKTIKWWVAFTAVMDMPLYWRWASPHPHLSVNCEMASAEPHVAPKSGRRADDCAQKNETITPKQRFSSGKERSRWQRIHSLNTYSAITIYWLDMFLVIIFRIILMAYTTLKGRQAIFMSVKRQHFSKLKNSALESLSIQWLNRESGSSHRGSIPSRHLFISWTQSLCNWSKPGRWNHKTLGPGWRYLCPHSGLTGSVFKQ